MPCFVPLEDNVLSPTHRSLPEQDKTAWKDTIQILHLENIQYIQSKAQLSPIGYNPIQKHHDKHYKRNHITHMLRSTILQHRPNLQ